LVCRRGRANPPPNDADADGLPDAWEIQYFGSIGAPNANPNADPDGDGFNNLQEYRAGTNPLDANSYLRFDSVTRSSGIVVLQFNAAAGKPYRVLTRTNVTSGTWQTLTNVPPQPTSGPMTCIDPNQGTTKFYRLVTP